MTRDTLATFAAWRVQIIFTMAAVLGLGGLAHELFLTTNPNWLKILASCTAISGQFVQLLNLSGKLSD